MESANKRLSESLGIAGRKRGRKLGAYLPFTGDANCHHQFMPLLPSHGAAWHVFPAHSVPIFSRLLQSPVYYYLFPCFSSSPTCGLSGFPSPRRCPLRPQGWMLYPALGKWGRRGAPAQAPSPKPQPCLWLPQEGFHSSGVWGGKRGKQLFLRIPDACVSVVCL